MKRRCRVWRVIKWAGLVASVVTALAWGLSHCWGFGYHYAGRRFALDVAVHRESLKITRANLHEAHTPPPERSGWFRVDSPFIDSRDYQFLLLRQYARYGVTCAEARWWLLPFVIILALPTALLWWRDRRPPAGHCRNCGYNLTGLPEPRCPECGLVFRPRDV